MRGKHKLKKLKRAGPLIESVDKEIKINAQSCPVNNVNQSTSARISRLFIAFWKSAIWLAKSFWKSIISAITFLLNLSFLLVLFTAALAVVGWQQRDISDRQLDTMKIDQRAWLKFSDTVFETKPEENKVPFGWTHILNTGKTPAFQVQSWTRMEILPKNQVPDLTLKGKAVTAFYAGTLLPQTPQDIPIHVLAAAPNPDGLVPKRGLNNTEADGLRTGKLYLVFFGEVDYRDVFNDNHWIKMCTLKGYKPDVVVPIRDCLEYNDMDKIGLAGFVHRPNQPTTFFSSCWNRIRKFL